MNQNPEQSPRDNIDNQLLACGWIIQDKKQVNLSDWLGVAIREYQTETRPADCILFIDRMGETITASLQQAEALRHSILKRAFEGKLVGEEPLKQANIIMNNLNNMTSSTVISKDWYFCKTLHDDGLRCRGSKF